MLFSGREENSGSFLGCGTGYIDKQNNLAHVFMDRGPIMGYTGYIVLSPIGALPPKVEPLTGDEDDDEV
jgi:hypothetical protein